MDKQVEKFTNWVLVTQIIASIVGYHFMGWLGIIAGLVGGGLIGFMFFADILED